LKIDIELMLNDGGLYGLSYDLNSHAA